MARRYEESHPFIDFSADVKQIDFLTWMLFGEAESKCEHVAGVPLKPAEADHLNRVYLSKGVHGTTAIEGNTLTEEQVLQVLDGELDLGPSRDYQEQEVKNIIDAHQRIIDDVRQDDLLELTPERIKEFNLMVLKDIDVADHVVPGEYRDDPVGVMRYRAVPPEDVDYLVARMCDWLSDLHADREDMTFAVAVFKSILAHLYLAWIHPFGDGNGRVARMIEFQILIEAGVPLPSAHLMSDFYNLTRDRYYIELDRTSTRRPYSIRNFVRYAVEGFVDQLREQLKDVRTFQLRSTWENYVHDVLGSSRETEALRRRKHLVFDLTEQGPTRKVGIPDLSPRLARAYAGKTTKTVTRDLTFLRKRNLIRLSGGRWAANIEVMEAFMPLRHHADE